MTLRLHTVVDGPADGVLVLGPSLGTDTGVWDDQLPVLAAQVRTVRFDLPGHGGSPDPGGPLTVADLADGVLAALDDLGVDRFHYAGVSLGGAIGQHLAVHSGRILSLIAVATSCRFPDPPSWHARAEAVRAGGTSTMVGSRAGVWYTDDLARNRPGRVAALLDMLRATSAEGYAACCEAVGTFDMRDALAAVTVPTTVVAGADDPATPPDHVADIATRIPGARLRVLPGAHLPNLESADAVTALLLDQVGAGVGRRRPEAPR
ncbi:MAG: alpha/beta fold hydrolase [Pseudonocardia sp.]|uniref:alpha/beta fold hydrolase n=1 Tax=unclassified Pseudonocardia TaxID=2619320 RepID=UPI00086AC484|nr:MULTISPECIES: alpha/beta fold hydrolase [unclassified Pseudonocardia]MBN9108188.1 alpha/beta fold hydrolase [Pseudonocardia sp.]ODU22448.1 MAG: 3-oxoadipate enol-lactonase [Pseudonocardia sp. SCN 72-51]ODV01669.1 MAG: 3-oxoadipate enol-lactonase [Pseudonocardia sp. SCN 73-27]